ncbi:MAG TPA: YetF domain-containing protein [Bordetella sp.]|nr:YetF domain-containing protein [Bordetella sp.]
MDVDWPELFRLTVPPLELIVRGSLMYWFILVVLRMAGRRDVGSLGVADMLVLVLIADAAQNGMAGQYQSITDGAILVATIVGWVALIDRLTFFLPWLGRLLEADKVCLVRDGQMLRRNMRREYITPEELMSELRQHGFEDLSSVRRAYIEPDGNISVLKRPGSN